jgi:hypothetical protein
MLELVRIYIFISIPYIFSSLNSCEIGSTRRGTFNDNIILYEDGQNTTQYEDHFLNDKEIKENGGLNGFSLSSIANAVKNFFKSIKNLFTKKSKRLFIKMHQYIGCSHLMSVRYFLASINNCSFVARYCRSQRDFFTNISKCHISTKDEIKSPPRMGYYADLSHGTFKTSFGNFFLNTTGKAPFCESKVKIIENKILSLLNRH